MIRRAACPCIGIILAAATAGWAQLDLPSLGGFANKPPAGVSHALAADVKTIAPTKPFRVGIAFTVQPDNHFYYKSAGSLGLPTKVSIQAPEGFKVGPVQFPAPEVKHEDSGKEAVVYYVYPRSTVIFVDVTPPVDLKPGAAAEFNAEVSYQFCNKDGCVPVRDRTLSLSLPVAAASEPSDQAKLFARAASQVPKTEEKGDQIVSVEPFLNVDALRPDTSAKLAVELSIEQGFHIQMNQPPDATLISTEIILDLPDGLSFTSPIFPQPLAPIKTLQGLENIREYRDRVTVIVPLQAKKYLQLGETTIRGLVRYQACDENGCRPPQYAAFRLTAPVVSKETKVEEKNDGVFDISTLGPAKGENNGDGLPAVRPGNEASTASDFFNDVNPVRRDDLGDSLGWSLVYAFLGGLLLNVMPCVLPVLAIKVLGFVNQAGESRWRIFLLNLAYSAGVIGVFLILASLAAFAGLLWGQLFQLPEFNLAMAGIVFAMGLSLLGVFDIPVPGFAGTVDTTKKEGPLGAFLTGVLATFLATPCTGPFIAPALSWSVSQPPQAIFAVWGVAGVGMAFPYLVCGAFPGFIRWLPKPGMWMVRFKELSGFVLMASVIYIISFLNQVYVLPLLVILLGVAVAVWMTSNLYDLGASVTKKWVVRVAAVTFAILSVAVALLWLKPVVETRARRDLDLAIARAGASVVAVPRVNQATIPWIPFTEKSLKKYIEEGRTIFIDFTADWCAVCIANEAAVLETAPIRKMVDELAIVTLKADMTHESEETTSWLKKFGGASIPHYVVLSANDPKRPIVFGGTVTLSQVMGELKAAGPSKSVAANPPATQVSMAP